jgi:hypothetical protein
MNTVAEPRFSRVEKHAMQVLEGPIEVYCENCHLATPTWRQKCLHCAKPFPQGTLVRSANQNRFHRGNLPR